MIHSDVPATVGGGDGDLDAELIGLVSFALADALGLWRVPAVRLAATLVVVLPADFEGIVEGFEKNLVQPLVSLDLGRGRGSAALTNTSHSNPPS